MRKLDRKDKLFLKVNFFLLNLLCLGIPIGYSLSYDEVVYALTLFGCIGWIMFTMPIFFKGWAKDVYDFRNMIGEDRN